jgi:hypothetical protein
MKDPKSTELKALLKDIRPKESQVKAVRRWLQKYPEFDDAHTIIAKVSYTLM